MTKSEQRALTTPRVSVEVCIFTVAGVPGPFIKGSVTRPASASDPADQEENAGRLAEQMVREAFRRLRERN
jgi:hypothetical protein